jgi:hypothetical protein
MKAWLQVLSLARCPSPKNKAEETEEEEGGKKEGD